MIAVAAVANVALIITSVFLLGEYGWPEKGSAMLIFGLGVVAPVLSLLALRRSDAREIVSWLALELQVRKATLRRRLAEQEGQAPTK